MGNIILSHKEIDRLTGIQNIISKQLTQAQAAAQLQLCVRQVKRLVRAYRLNGVEGLISGHRHAWFEDRGPICCFIIFINAKKQ